MKLYNSLKGKYLFVHVSIDVLASDQFIAKICTLHFLIATFFLSVIQVFYVIVQFGGLLPETVLIQRRKLDLDSDSTAEQPWLDWQYMARNCSVFEMQNNGPLLKSDSVNCMQLPK